MTHEKKRRRDAAYRKGFEDGRAAALAAMEVIGYAGDDFRSIMDALGSITVRKNKGIDHYLTPVYADREAGAKPK